MKWIKVDPANLPKGLVLGLDTPTLLIGKVTVDRDYIYCSTDNEAILLSHYLPIEDLLNLPKE